MGQTGGAVQAIAGAAPNVATLILTVPALARVAVVVPSGGYAAGPTGDTDLASRAGSAGRTDAGVTRDAVHAGRAVGARIARALVHVDATVRAGKAGRALASEPIHAVDALAAVQAWQRLTVVDVAPAIRPFEALPTHATVVTVGRVHAGRPILAWITHARR